MVSRIKQLLDWQQLSPTQFADRIGVGRPVVSHILSERNKPSLDVVLHIRQAFPELSLQWLLEGVGEMLETTAPAAIPPPATAAPDIAAPTRRLPAATPVPSPAPAAELAAVPAGRPAQRAAGTAASPPLARFQPTKPLQEVAQPASNAMPVATPTPAAALVPEPTAVDRQPAPVVATPAPAEATAAPADNPATHASPTTEVAIMAAGLAGPGKEKPIRRIVIFYRDGSFADYQPEY